MSRRARPIGWTVALLSALLTLAAAWAVAPARAADSPRVIVSLTFDDGFGSQSSAAQILRERGMRGTFYVNSGMIGEPGRLSREQLRKLVADGHEIGGHTTDHVHLPTVDTSEELRQVCDDRVAIERLAGTTPRSFAFPYGAHTPAAEAVVARCGYNSARRVGGIHGSAYAESLKPVNKYAVRSGLSFVPATSVSTAKEQIRQALEHGGGWVPFVFHEVCDGCSSIAVSPRDLSALVAWIERAGPSVKVMTVGEVIGGPTRPLVDGPRDTRPPGRVVNGSLEARGAAEGGVDPAEEAYCWQRAGYGDSGATWRRTSPGHSGRWAEQVVVTEHASGDRKLLTRPDRGSCAPKVLPGSAYTFGAWYRASGPVRLVVFYRRRDGRWTFWKGSPPAGPSSSWRQVSWTSPPMPSDAERVAFGLQFTDDGSYTVDDLSMEVAPTADSWPTMAVPVAFLGLIGLPVAGFTLRRRLRRA